MTFCLLYLLKLKQNRYRQVRLAQPLSKKASSGARVASHPQLHSTLKEISARSAPGVQRFRNDSERSNGCRSRICSTPHTLLPKRKFSTDCIDIFSIPVKCNPQVFQRGFISFKEPTTEFVIMSRIEHLSGKIDH